MEEVSHKDFSQLGMPDVHAAPRQYGDLRDGWGRQRLPQHFATCEAGSPAKMIFMGAGSFHRALLGGQEVVELLHGEAFDRGRHDAGGAHAVEQEGEVAAPELGLGRRT